MDSSFIEELEVLRSIYGNDSILFDPDYNMVEYISESGLHITFNIKIDYPASKITWKVDSIVNKGKNINNLLSWPSNTLRSEVDAYIEENIGNVMLFQVIEMIRSDYELQNTNTESSFADIIDEGVSSGKLECIDEVISQSKLTIYHGETINERKSTFIAHFCVVTSMEEVYKFRSIVLSDKKIARATHNIFAYRFTHAETGVIYHDNDDDGETAAGGRLAEMLRLMNADGVAVIVSRWFGGILLGPDRFKFICNAARNLLESHGYGVTKRK